MIRYNRKMMFVDINNEKVRVRYEIEREKMTPAHRREFAKCMRALMKLFRAPGAEQEAQ